LRRSCCIGLLTGLLLTAAGAGRGQEPAARDARWPVRLTVHDQVARPDAAVALTAKLEHAGFPYRDLSGCCLSCGLAGEAWTGREGIATFTLEFPPGTPSPQAVEVCFAGSARLRPAAGCGRVFLWDCDRPILVTDIDNTISDRLLFLVPVTPIAKNATLPDAAAVLTELAQHYHIVYLTCRPAWLHGKTRAWLAAHGFPEGPLFCRDFRLGQSQEGYKRQFLTDFKARFPNLAIGVGNTSSDAGAYQSAGMQTLIIEPKGGNGTEAFRVVRGWREVGKVLREGPGSP
jgi:hypothetical protein